MTGFITSSIAWYYYWIWTSLGILLASAAVDLIMYSIVGNLLQCYRCHAGYRGVPGLDTGDHFNLETHERYRQEKIRIAQQEKMTNV